MTDKITYEGWATKAAWETHLAISNTRRLNDRKNILLKTAMRWGATVGVLAYELQISFPSCTASEAAWLELAQTYYGELATELLYAAGEYVKELNAPLSPAPNRTHETLRAGRQRFGKRAFDAEVDELFNPSDDDEGAPCDDGHCGDCTYCELMAER